MQANTFSIAARCPRTGMLGVAVSTAVPAVGSLCPHVRPGIGAVSTQAWVNPYLAFAVLARLAEGASAQAALDAALSADEAAAVRQIGVVDAAGRSAVWSGAECTPWFGHRSGAGYAIQGNMLTGPEVLKGMEAAFVGSEPLELGERLMLALEAGQRAGGDKRGKQSAALVVYDREDYPWIDVRVDEHPMPVTELRRVFTIHQFQVRPFLEGMPKKGQPARPTPESVVEMLLRPPPLRPGGERAREQGMGRLQDVVGLDLSDEEIGKELAAFADIGAAIRKLRELDLTEVHPVVIYDPALPFRKGAP